MQFLKIKLTFLYFGLVWTSGSGNYDYDFKYLNPVGLMQEKWNFVSGRKSFKTSYKP